MSKHISWSGTHPSLAILAEVRQELDAAEQRVKELEEDLEVCRGEMLEERDENGELRDMIDALRREVVELQAQLDKGWTPPQEPPSENTYVEMIVKGHYHWQFDEWSVLPIDEQLISDHVMGWRIDPEEPWGRRNDGT